MDLHPGEEMVFDGHPSWRAVLTFYVSGVVVVAVLTAIAALVGSAGVAIVVAIVALGVMILVGLIKRQATRYVITSERLHIRHGIFSKRTQETRIQRVQNVNTDQSLFERIMRVGTVDFDTAGTDDSEFRFVGVASPDEVVRAVDKAQRAAAVELREARERDPSPSRSPRWSRSGGAGSRPGRAGARRRARSPARPPAARRRSPGPGGSSRAAAARCGARPGRRRGRRRG